MPLFRKQGVPSESPKAQPSVIISQDDSDFSLYQTMSDSSVADLPHGVPGRSRSSTVTRFKNLFNPHEHQAAKMDRAAGSGSHTRKAASPPKYAGSSNSSPKLESAAEHKAVNNAELVDSLTKLKMMSPVAENDLDSVIENSEKPVRLPSLIPHSGSNASSSSSVTSQAPARGRSGKFMSKFLGNNLSEESLSPPLSRSNSNNSRQRSSSVSVANSESSQHSYIPLKHTSSASYSQIHMNSQREHLMKLKNGRLKVAPDGSMHEHDYLKYRTPISKNTKSWWGWTKKREVEDDEFLSIENSVSLLPDSYSLQLMELKSDPKNYRWNYDDSDSDSGSDSDDDSEEEEDDDFDDEADDQLIEPIIGKDQLTLMNMMMDKIEKPEKFKEKLQSSGSKKMTLSSKYGHIGGVVGRGSFGTVCISALQNANNKKRKSLFAIKQLKQRPGESLHHFGNRVTSEFMISSSLTHQAVINVYDLMVDPVTMTYSQVMEFMPCGDLFTLIAMTNGLEVVECDCFFKQILNAITYLHSVGISHNDLKVENLLLTRKGQLKIIDFGTSAVFKTAWEDKVQFCKGACGSERYVSPEQFVPDKSYDPRLADIWSLGIIYLVMLYGTYVWEIAKRTDESYEHFLETRAIYDYTTKSKSASKQFRLIRKGTFNQIESISKGPCASSRRYVLYNILNPDPKYRMRSYQIWQSEWVKSIHVCEAGRGFLSQEDYIDMAYKTLNEEQTIRRGSET
ncbi:hypothetical protein KL933_000644 [Ogataea haglerorum]|uniref:Protein kinase domain-containing protein n=1 Tax=Ogataea haglerorum TaxID=1937702 RepID=A0AAN6I370_9ASCO|nr:hypothetical protein KL933_000644 [Ogataea haglerorum]